MINALDDSIRHLLVSEGALDPSEIDISFDLPNRDWSGGISRPTINCYLFDLRENLDAKHQGMVNEQKGGITLGRRQAPIFFDLSYLVTSWTHNVDDEHQLLWHTLQTLVRFSRIPAAHLQGVLRSGEVSAITKTGRPDGVLKGPGDFWSSIDNHLKPSINYVVTLGLPRELLEVGPPVLTSRLRLGQRDLAPADDLLTIAGTVRTPHGRPINDVELGLVGYAGFARSDRDGRFRLKIPAAGTYTLVARHGNTVHHRQMTVPGSDYDITFGDDS